MLYIQVPLNQPIIVGPERLTVVHKERPRYFTVEHRGRAYKVAPGRVHRLDLQDGWIEFGTASKAYGAPQDQVRLGVSAPAHWRITRPR